VAADPPQEPATLGRLIAYAARVPYVALDDAQLYYEEHGAGDPLLLVHGFTLIGQMWADFLPSFTDRYRVIVPELRGHGRSTGAPETIRHDHFAADLVALLDHLDVDRVHCVGTSSGAMCSLFVGTQRQRRLRTLALISGTYTWDERRRAYGRSVAAAWETDPAWIDQPRQRHGATHGAEHWRVLADKLRTWVNGPDELPFRPADLAAITCPVLVLHGDRDPFFPLDIATTMYQAMPNAELAILPAVEHALPWERPDRFVRVLADFLARHAGA
jgi:pimeloyl-ACP methyl ester carboxylesterase